MYNLSSQYSPKLAALSLETTEHLETRYSPSADDDSCPISSDLSDIYQNIIPNSGWSICVHPQGWIYFYNRKLRATTEEDLRSENMRNLIEQKCALYPLSDLEDQLEVHLNGSMVSTTLIVNHKHCVASYDIEEMLNERVAYLNPNELNRRKRLYWNHLWNHPVHRPAPDRAIRDALDAVTWFYTDNLLSGPRSVVPFSKSESEELSRVLKNMRPAGSGNASGSPAQTVFLAWLLREVCSFRDAESYGMYTHKESWTMSRLRHKSRNPSTSHPAGPMLIFLSLVINIFFFSIPWSYRSHVMRASTYHGRLENLQHNWHAYTERLSREYSHFLLISTVLLSATVGFLAIPDLSKATVIFSIISAFSALNSIIVGVFTIWKHQSNTESKNAFTYMNNIRQNRFGFHGHAMLLSLPAVLLVYALIAFAAALFVYTISWLQASGTLHDWSWWVVIGVVIAMLASVAAALYTFAVIWNFRGQGGFLPRVRCGFRIPWCRLRKPKSTSTV